MTFPPGASVPARGMFHKVWTIRNDGSEAWPEGCVLIHVGGDLLGFDAGSRVAVSSVAPGQETQVVVPLVAPELPGRYVGYWRLVKADGKRFGQRLCCDVLVQQ